MNIENLISQAKDGDLKSFAMLYKKYRDMVLNYIIYLGVPTNDAEEICDDVFLHVYDKIDAFRCDTEDEL